jgi:predicted ATPase
VSTERITSITIEGLRSIDRLTLPLDGLTVLIGENGSGKSSIVEACEILRRVSDGHLPENLGQIHGGLFSLRRHGAAQLGIWATIEGDGSPMRYGASFAGEDRAPSFRETLETRTGDEWVPSPNASPEEAARVRSALGAIEVHLPFDVLPMWASRAHNRPSALRTPETLQATDRLGRFGSNLASGFYTLRNEMAEDHWRTTMEYVRLGLGSGVESVNARLAAGGGAALWVKYLGRDDQIPASALADGTLVFLALVALFRLRRPRSLLVFDEPDLHLHPGLLPRVAGFFEAMAEDGPVLITTHSDRLLDALHDPAHAVRVCEIKEPEHATRVRSLDASALADWLSEYRGVGELVATNHLGAVLRAKPEP